MWCSILHKWNIIWLSKGWWPNKYYVVKKKPWKHNVQCDGRHKKPYTIRFCSYEMLWRHESRKTTSRRQFPEHPRKREGTAAQQAWCFLLQWQIKGSDVCVAQCICGEPSNSTYTWKWWVSCHVIVVRWRMAHYFFSLEAWKSLLISSLSNSFQHMT